MKKLTAGTKLSSVYEAAIKFVKDENPNLLDHLTKNFGFAMGIEFRESSLLIGPKTNAVAKKGMVFNVNVGLSNLTNSEAKDKESKNYALFIGDTVFVNEVQSNILQVDHFIFMFIRKSTIFINVYRLQFLGPASYYSNSSKEKNKNHWYFLER